jgi:kumamolisin
VLPDRSPLDFAERLADNLAAMPKRKEEELPGSTRTPLASAGPGTAISPDAHAEVTVVLRRRHPAPRTRARRSTPLSIEELEAQQGASADDISAVERFARAHDLTVGAVDAGRRTVVLSGTLANLCRAFSTELRMHDTPSGRFRMRTGPIYVPAELAGVVEGVFGLDDRPAATPKFRYPSTRALTAYTPTQVGAAYGFPAGLDGKGQCIALIELGGGFKASELDAYFSSLKITPAPKVTAIGVDGGKNAPTGDPQGPDGEVVLDIEVSGALAPGATIAVYFAPNTDRGFIDAILAAIHDKTRQPSVVSISWGSPESNWTEQALKAFDGALQDASLLGVTVCCAAGDGGSGDGAPDGLAHADFPASSAFALACGGTRLVIDQGRSTETVWNDGANGATGGGVSDVFPLPDWQKAAGIPVSANPGHRVGRGLPDLAGNAAPETGYEIRADGEETAIGGTSAVAPLVAALIARCNQGLGRRVGFLNPVLYTQAAVRDSFRDITEGTNGAYAAGPGWDACTGWGSPRGDLLLAALGGSAPAGKRSTAKRRRTSTPTRAGGRRRDATHRRSGKEKKKR